MKNSSQKQRKSQLFAYVYFYCFLCCSKISRMDRICLLLSGYLFLGPTNLIFSLTGETMKNLGSVGPNKKNIMDLVKKCRFLKADL